jgi:hypothetical protein
LTLTDVRQIDQSETVAAAINSLKWRETGEISFQRSHRAQGAICQHNDHPHSLCGGFCFGGDLVGLASLDKRGWCCRTRTARELVSGPDGSPMDVLDHHTLTTLQCSRSHTRVTVRPDLAPGYGASVRYVVLSNCLTTQRFDSHL